MPGSLSIGPHTGSPCGPLWYASVLQGKDAAGRHPRAHALGSPGDLHSPRALTLRDPAIVLRVRPWPHAVRPRATHAYGMQGWRVQRGRPLAMA